uniref:Acid phosphatase n=1 Tax=Globodera rostochiensis TaxID=31243 RepID=A0A914H941_GLORO
MNYEGKRVIIVPIIVILLMASLLLILLLILNFSIFNNAQQQQPKDPNQRQLLYVQAIWRHGDRAPGKLPYPGDPYDEKYWPRGWSQLTNLGMAQMRELGQFLRQRYIMEATFLGASYNRDDVFIQSSGSDRALVSAQALLQGMYPPLAELEQFDPTLNWQPIPVHSTGLNHELLKPTSFACPVYDRLKKEVKLELEQQLVNKYPDLFNFIQLNVYKSSQPISLHQAAKLSNINREVLHNLSQPEWVNRRWPQYGDQSTLELLIEIRRLERTREFARPDLAFLKGGFLLGDWVQRAKQVLQGQLPKEANKAVLYSAHDGTLQALLSSMGLGDDQMVPYSACVMMELYNSTNVIQLEIYYRHNGILDKLNLTECGSSFCTADEAIQLLEKRAIFGRQKLFEQCEKDGFCEIPVDNGEKDE